MKKILFLISVLFVSNTVISQETSDEKETNDNYNKWSLEFEVGAIKPTRTFTTGYYTTTPTLGQVSLGARYMFNNKFGAKLDGGFASIEGADNSRQFQTNNFRASLQGVMNLRNILDFSSWSNTIGLLFHAGGGYSFNSYDEDLLGRASGNDQMLHIMAGLTPQIKLSDRFVLTADITAIGNIRQTRAWDGNTTFASNRGFDGFALNTSVGLTFYLGKNDSHIDWASDDSYLEDEIISLQERLAKVENDLIDSDMDGVADYLDRELNTVSGVAVNTKGIAVDKNKNGIPDELEKGLRDTYLAIKDYSPESKSNTTSSTSPRNFIKSLLNEGYVNVYFDTNSSNPETYSLDAINYLKMYMIDNPSATAELTGYADEIGNASSNLVLSQKRAKKVYDILIASGIQASRLTHSGGGEDASVDRNSKEARQLLRRVTFKLN